MADGMGEILVEARKNKLADIWNNLTDGDIIKVWDTMSALIRRTMVSQQRGIVIPGLATMTLSKISLEVGNNKELCLQRPTFVLLEKFARVHQLRGGATLTPGGAGVTVIPLNIAQVAMDAQMNRDDVDSCVREVVSAMSRMVASKRSVDLTFNGIGRLQIRDTRVKMKFFKGFVESADGSGRLVSSMQGRPGTADSVISESGFDQNRKSLNLLNTHKIIYGFNSDDPALPIIRELREGIEDNDDENYKENLRQLPDVINFESNDYLPTASVEKPSAGNDQDVDIFSMNELEMDETKTFETSHINVWTGRNTRTPMTVPRANAVNFTYSEVPPRSGSQTHRSNTHTLSQTGRFDSSIQEKRIRFSPEPPSNYSPAPSVRSHASCSVDFDRGIYHDRADSIVSEGPTSPFTRSKALLPHPPMSRSYPSCSHSENAGQELCYICHQRASYNNAMDLSEERRRRAAEEDRRLREFRLAKNSAEISKEQEVALARRNDNEEVALYNLQSSELATANQLKSNEFCPSFVLRRRPATPPRFIAQENYGRELDRQVLTRDETERKRKEDRELLERLEQVLH